MGVNGMASVDEVTSAIDEALRVATDATQTSTTPAIAQKPQKKSAPKAAAKKAPAKKTAKKA